MFLKWYQKNQCQHIFTYIELMTKNKKKFLWVNSQLILLFKLNFTKHEMVKCSKLYFWYLFFFTCCKPAVLRFRIFKKSRKFAYLKKKLILHFIIQSVQSKWNKKNANIFHYWFNNLRQFPQQNLKALQWDILSGIYYLSFDRPVLNNWNFEFLNLKPIVLLKIIQNYLARSYLNFIRFNNLCKFSKKFLNKH